MPLDAESRQQVLALDEMLSTLKDTILRCLGLRPRKSRPSVQPLQQPLPHIAEAFQHYICNHIPTRLIDTTTFKFVERDAVYNIFYSDIARITDKDVRRRTPTVSVNTHPEAGIYVKPDQVALQETIRDVVRYAIFSHRWTDCEPSYQDVSGSGSPGSFGRRHSAKTAKLVQLCKTARALGYKLVWSDTCCIDKTNTAELSEAIHAMFKWYAHAHVCIVHLAASLSLVDFEREPWFKRGWTLQELLAPRQIKFYNKCWLQFTSLANDKDDQTLMSALSAVTGIPQNVVVADNSRGIQGRSVWEIMSWAAPRKTTRIEDAAYCLCGLFDINLAIAYGEGEKAFPRLVEAIVARNPTWDAFAWAGQASERHPALPSSPACYPKWDAEMMRGEVGMTTFTLTPQALRMTSVPLIPMAFLSNTEAEAKGSFVVTLRPRSSAATTLGVYGNVGVICGSSRLQHIRDAVDLHACILNYKPTEGHHGMLQAGRTYVCFLLHMGKRNNREPTWLKFATDNVLRITCRDVPAVTRRTGLERASETGDPGLFYLPLETTCIRTPRAQSTLRT